MTIGIAAIVFLVSIGYGVQEMVISRVARLEEMKQADITTQVGGRLKINDKTISDFEDIPEVVKSLPLISVVGKISYKSSVSDMAVYGVTSEYLKQSAIQPTSGKIFESDDLIINSMIENGKVAGVAKESGLVGKEIRAVSFTINPTVWLEVHETPDLGSKILGYTKRVEGLYEGVEIWGGSYGAKKGIGMVGEDVSGKVLGKWIGSEFLLWKKGGYSDEGYQVLKGDEDFQLQSKGYIIQEGVKVEQSLFSSVKVLGVSDTLPKVEIPSESGSGSDINIKKINLGDQAIKEAVINRAALRVLGLEESEAIGKVFSASFVVVGDLLENPDEKIESNETEYTIVGVIPDDKTPVIYVPFIDIRSLGVVNYSQLKLVVKDKSDLVKVRYQVEAMGYVTRSVADTVNQINNIFSTAKLLLALFGSIALIVASLGMFNTLTVSLLERTREVGLMKAMGMKSSEVKELFLTESVIMGVLGGVFGILLGVVSGTMLGIGLSIFAAFKGGGTIDISALPLAFVVFIIALSLAVGILTGLYPAKRATKISVLDALRYE